MAKKLGFFISFIKEKVSHSKLTISLGQDNAKQNEN